MPRAAAAVIAPVERFFQLSLLGLLTSGYLAVAGSGYLDAPTIAITGIGLALRFLLVTGLAGFEIPDRFVAVLTVAYIGFYPIDYQFVSRGFLEATVHLVFFLAVMKILTARSNRDYLYTAAIAFLEILAAAILSANLNFFLFLALYLLFGIAAFTSAEIRRSMQKEQQVARSGLRHCHSRLAGLAVSITAGILVLTAGLFLILPRAATMRRLISHRYHLPGFSNEVTLGQIGEIKNDSRAVMHVRSDGAALPPNLKWRGAALSEFDGKRWFNPRAIDQHIRVQEGWIPLADDFQRRRAGKRLEYRVDLNAVDSDALFIAGFPEFVQLSQHNLLRTATDSYRLGYIPYEPLRYGVSSFPDNGDPWPDVPVLSPEIREQYLRLPPLDSRIAALAKRWTADQLSDFDRARSLESHLRKDFGYTLELPSQEAADPLAYFLFDRKKGHCEYFASAMTVMLRAFGIPARVVNGFQSGTFNPISGQYVIRASDAHSWVEAYLPARGWTTFDPTPPDPRPPSVSFMAKFALYMDAADTWWQDWVLSYDLGRQLMLAERMERSTRLFGPRWIDGWNDAALQWTVRMRSWLVRYGAWILAMVILGGVAVATGPSVWRFLHMRRRFRRLQKGRASMEDATVLYQRMLQILRNRGFQKPAWFTPNEFAASLPVETAAVVKPFTEAYQALRFGGKPEAAPQLGTLLKQLERK